MFNKKIKSRECLNTLYSFNLLTNAWTKLQPIGDYVAPRRNHKVCLYGNKYFLVYGGINANEKVLSDMALFNLEKGVWKYLGDQQGQELAYHAIVNVTKVRKYDDTDSKDNYPKDEIYCFGGKDATFTSVNTIKRLIYS